MEVKKYPSVDVHKNRGRFFLIGFAISLTAVIVAFEWTVEKVDYCRELPVSINEEPVFAIPVTSLPEPKRVIEVVRMPSIPEYVEVNELTEGPLNEKASSFADTVSFVEPIVESIPEEIPNDIVDWTEEMPEPEDGYASFYTFLARELRYPRQAQRVQTEGKVFISFVVNLDGRLTELKVVKGIGMGCDEEALRVLSSTRWKPGRQSGRKVRVRMIQPIHFRLQN